MSYKVALGLADAGGAHGGGQHGRHPGGPGVGANFNGQSLGGGLPYAMMGVPLMPMAGGAATVRIVEAACAARP